MNITKLILMICILFFIVSTARAAFFEETIEGNITNISGNYFYIGNEKVDFPSFVINNIEEGDSIVYGSPEPFLIVYKDNKIEYAYGDVFHFSNSANLVNGVNIERQKTKKFSGKSAMVDVTTYFRVTKFEDVNDFSLNPGEYTIFWNTVVAVHQAEEPNVFMYGPQHWYVYEIYTNQTNFSNELNLKYAKPSVEKDDVKESGVEPVDVPDNEDTSSGLTVLVSLIGILIFSVGIFLKKEEIGKWINQRRS